MFKNGVGRNTIMIFTFSNGDVVKTSEIAFVSTIKAFCRGKLNYNLYYNITLNNKIELERNLSIYIYENEIYEQFQKGLYRISVTPNYIMNSLKGSDARIEIFARDVLCDEINIKFEELESFKFFSQERLDLINKLT